MSQKSNPCYNRHKLAVTLITRRTFLVGCAGAVCGSTILSCKKSSDAKSGTFVKIANIQDLSEGPTTFPLERIVLYREGGSIKALSLVCTHQECLISQDERGFVCPCHGSRFDIEGRVLTGPATQDLHWLPVEVDSVGDIKVNFKQEPL